MEARGTLRRQPAKAKRATSPTARQVAVTREMVAWYLRVHRGRLSDLGGADMYCDPARVGPLAVSRSALQRGEGGALFRMLVATTLFQRQADRQVLRILREMPVEGARELGSAERLLELVDEGRCPRMVSTEALRTECDLDKDPVTREGCCSANPEVACHLKRHTVLLRRYGHFGKVPTSVALTLRELGVDGLPGLYAWVRMSVEEPEARARALEESLSRAWRVNQKVACMFLAAISNPDLSPGLTPWQEGLDWTYFVVVDSNADLFLGQLGYRGGNSYDARRAFFQELARRIDLSEMDASLRPYNPRLVQQAAYLFMSASNRRLAPHDCMHAGPSACGTCPKALADMCPVRAA